MSKRDAATAPACWSTISVCVVAAGLLLVVGTAGKYVENEADQELCKNHGTHLGKHATADKPCSCVQGYRGKFCSKNCTECHVEMGVIMVGFELAEYRDPNTIGQCVAMCLEMDKCWAVGYIYEKIQMKATCYFMSIPYLNDDYADSIVPVSETWATHYLCAFNCRKD